MKKSRFAKLGLESLESRVVPADLFWAGNATDGFWWHYAAAWRVGSQIGAKPSSPPGVGDTVHFSEPGTLDCRVSASSTNVCKEIQVSSSYDHDFILDDSASIKVGNGVSILMTSRFSMGDSSFIDWSGSVVVGGFITVSGSASSSWFLNSGSTCLVSGLGGVSTVSTVLVGYTPAMAASVGILEIATTTSNFSTSADMFVSSLGEVKLDSINTAGGTVSGLSSSGSNTLNCDLPSQLDARSSTSTLKLRF